MNTLHENLVLSLIEASQFANKCAYEEGMTETGISYSDIYLALVSLTKQAVWLGGEA